MKPKKCTQEECTMIKYKSLFRWFSYTKKTKEGKIIKTKLMPSVSSGKNDIRVNYCPTCSAEVRDMQIKTEL